MKNVKFVNVQWLIVDFCMKHPSSIVVWDDTEYRYNLDNKLIEYRKPNNKKLNNWYIARGFNN